VIRKGEGRITMLVTKIIYKTITSVKKQTEKEAESVRELTDHVL